MSTSVTVDTKKLNQILKRLPGNAQDNLRAIAFAIEREAKKNAPVDTGALRASIYIRVGKRGNDLPSVGGDALRVPLPPPESDMVAHVGPSVNYAIFVELGTVKQSAQPYLGPAVKKIGGDFDKRWGEVVTDG